MAVLGIRAAHAIARFTTPAAVRGFRSAAPSWAHKRVPSLAAIQSVDILKYSKEKTPDEKLSEGLQESAEQELRESEASSGGLIKSFFFGSPTAKKELAEMEVSFSQKLMRGKYVHEIVFHDVVPSKITDYNELVAQVYPRISEDPDIPCRLVGSWRTVIGNMDRFVHIWEYDGFPGFHNAHVLSHSKDFYLDYLAKLRESLFARNNHIIQEFGFWGGTSAPHDFGGVFELRAYDLKPGKLAEWETHWQKGIEVRRQVMEPVGAWFTSIGPLNRVYHLWQFVDLEHRKISRQKSWELPGWADTTHKTVELVDHMEANVMVPLTFSPLK